MNEQELPPYATVTAFIIKATTVYDSRLFPSANPVGTILAYYSSEMPIRRPPEGWLFCDGKCYKRNHWPELAACCRSFTGWIRWHIFGQFYVPNMGLQFNFDPGQIYDRSVST